MNLIVCECQAGRERQMYLIWFTQTLGRWEGWRASWVSWQALNLEPLLLFRYAYSLTVAKFARALRLRTAGDECAKKDGYQKRTEVLWECSQVIKCMSHDQHLKGEDISQNTLKPFKWLVGLFAWVYISSITSFAAMTGFFCKLCRLVPGCFTQQHLHPGFKYTVTSPWEN